VLALAAAGLLAFSALGAPAVWSQQLVADLSEHLIGITTGFSGTDVVLFGTVDAPGEVRVVVSGPPETVTVRRQGRVAGIWVNRDRAVFPGVPGFRAVAEGRFKAGAAPEVKPPPPGVGALKLDPAEPLPPDELAAFRAALIRAKQRDGLYTAEVKPVAFLGERLFRTDLHFPANVPTGLYSVQVFLLQNGEVLSAQTTPLAVSKIGFSADVSRFARNWPLAYGFAAVLGAILAGWGGASLLRRV
jgi:uncharacterized protein (TIGR02186 family)